MLDMAINISKYSSSDFCSGLPDIKLLCFHSMDLDLFHPCEFDIENAINYELTRVGHISDVDYEALELLMSEMDAGRIQLVPSN